MLDSQQIFDGTIAATGVPTGAAITTSRVSTNVLDMLAQRDLDKGAEMNVTLTQAFVGGTSLQISAQSSPDNATFVDLLFSPVYLTANLVLGARLFNYRLPIFQLNDTGLPNRYYRLNYTVVGTYTAGAVFSYLSADRDRYTFNAYPRNYTQTA